LLCNSQAKGVSRASHAPVSFIACLPISRLPATPFSQTDSELTFRYFRRAKLSYFYQQLQQYGFHCLTFGQDEGSYYHESFIRGKPGLAHYMGRSNIEASGGSESGDSNDACDTLPPSNTCTAAIHSFPISFDIDNLQSNSDSLSSLHPPENLLSARGITSALDAINVAPMSEEDQSELEEELELYRYLVDSREFLRDSALHGVLDIASMDNK
jgi:HSF-type DNA-binding